MAHEELNLDDPIRTRDGRAVRVLCTDSKATTGPLAVLRMTHDGQYEELRSYRRNGRRHTDPSSYADSRDDLVNVP